MIQSRINKKVSMYGKIIVKFLKDRENPEDWDENDSSCIVEHQYDISDQEQFYIRKNGGQREVWWSIQIGGEINM